MAPSRPPTAAAVLIGPGAVIDDGAGYVFTFWIGPLIDYGFIIDYSIIEGYNPI